MTSDRVQSITHKGKKILCMDYSNLTPEEVIQLIGEEVKATSREPIGSALVLSDFSNTRFNMSIINAFNKAVAEYTKYYKASAFLGVTGLVKIMFDTVTKLTKQELKLFNNRAEALDWLAGK